MSTVRALVVPAAEGRIARRLGKSHSVTTIELDRSEHEIVVRLSGEVDVSDAYTVPETVYGAVEAVSQRPLTVILDLSAVTFMDSTGLSMLIRTDGEMREIGVGLVLREPSEPVSRVLTMTALSGHFRIEGARP